ncbi:MAG: phosphoribosyltransferase [Acidimicrobiales bacterium]
MSLGTVFADRVDAGRQLGAALGSFAHQEPVVLGLARGGVPVAAEVARTLGAPLDVLLVRKLGVPFQRELAFGAISEGGAKVLSPQLIRNLALSEGEMATVEDRERSELARRLVLYRAGREPVSLLGRTVIIVDDGLATGATARVAVQVVRARGARSVVVAVPVGSREARDAIARLADAVICLSTPQDFRAVGQWYEDFDQTTDEAVTRLLDEFLTPPSTPPHTR